jgi:lipopolysaccharide transport system permease protein
MTSISTSITGGWVMPRRVRHLRDLLRELVVRDMKLRYKRSYLGIAWTLINPLMQLLVYTFVFRVLFGVQTPNYMLQLFIGITCWTWFQSGVLESTVAILQNRDLIRQPSFPAALLPNVTVGTHLVHFLLTFPITFAMIFYGEPRITLAVLWVPLVILVQYILTLALGMAAACLHAHFRDTQYLLGVFLMLGFFLTPIIYDMSVVPAKYHTFYMLNPMTHILDSYRAALVRGEAPHLASLGIVAAVSVILLWLSHKLFRTASVTFVEEF